MRASMLVRASALRGRAGQMRSACGADGCKWAPIASLRDYAAKSIGKPRATAANPPFKLRANYGDRRQTPKHVGPAARRGQAFVRK